MSKRIFALLLALVMVLAVFAGCGSKNDSKIWNIGGIGPTTGPAATYGKAVENAAKLAVDEINAAGGINGYQIKFNFEDDEHDPEKSVNAYNTLKDKGMQILMGTVTSKPCIAVAAETFKDNMFQITPSGSAVECVANDNAFRVCFNDPNQGAASADYIADNKIASKVAIIYDSSDVYSSGIYEKFVAEAAVKKLEVVAEEAFTSDSNSDFSVQIQKVKESKAELVFLPIYYKEAALILQQSNKAGLDVKFFGCDGLDGIIDQLGDDVNLAEDVMLLTPFAADAKDEKTVKFVEAYKKAYDGAIPNQFAADGYDAIYAIKAAIEKADIKPSLSVSDICEALKAAMTKITVDGVTGEMTWTADGEPTKTPKAVKISNGAYVAM